MGIFLPEHPPAPLSRGRRAGTDLYQLPADSSKGPSLQEHPLPSEGP